MNVGEGLCTYVGRQSGWDCRVTSERQLIKTTTYHFAGHHDKLVDRSTLEVKLIFYEYI